MTGLLIFGLFSSLFFNVSTVIIDVDENECHDVDDHRAGTNVFDIDENNSHDEDNTPISNLLE